MPSIPQPDWRQGSIIPHQELGIDEHILSISEPLEQGTLLILISQDCDIVNPSYDDEPFVELLIARPLTPKQKDGNLLHGKNPRRFQFTLNTSSGRDLYEISIHEKRSVDRSALLEIAPRTDVQLDSATIDALIKWTAKRYTRAAFPTEFNERCRPAMSRINRQLKAKGELITGIFLRLNTMEELPSERAYQVILRATAQPEDIESEVRERDAILLVERIERELNNCAGIEVVDARVVSEEDFSLSDLRQTRRWDYDFLSYRGGDVEQIAPEE